MQTLLEAEQVCAELQHGVSCLESRLAELLHWEAEARELYPYLKAAERRQRGQDPRARVGSRAVVIWCFLSGGNANFVTSRGILMEKVAGYPRSQARQGL